MLLLRAWVIVPTVPSPGQHWARQVEGTLPASRAPTPLGSEPSDASPLPTSCLPRPWETQSFGPLWKRSNALPFSTGASKSGLRPQPSI